MDFPKYSAYVPVFNQAATLGACVASLRAQTVPPAEILVVDDGSTDDSVKIAETAGAMVLRQSRNLGRGAARARAMETAQAEWVLGCDAGNCLAPDFAERALPQFADQPRLAAVDGWWAQSREGGVINRWRNRHLFTPLLSANRPNSTHITSGCVVRRAAVLAVGNYDANLRAGEDAELGRRLQAAGWEIWLDPALRIECLTKDTLTTVFERYARWNETHAGDAPLWRDYFRRCGYAVKVLAKRDIHDGDWASAAISLMLPNYLALRAWRRRKAQPVKS